MPKGLAFLSKKSWHTSNMCNQEKVWIAEQEKKAEDIKTKELARQIYQEREEEELHRLSGKKSNRLDRGIDWMYQGGIASGNSEAALTGFEEEQKKKEHEDYLLGKEFNPSNSKKGDLASASEPFTGVNMIITRSSDGFEKGGTERISENVQDWNSNFHLKHEDPMFLVEQQRNEKKMENEKKRRLFESVNEGDYCVSQHQLDRGVSMESSAKKKRKERKKHRHKRSRRNDYDNDYRDRREYRKDKKRKSRHHRSYSSETDDRKASRKSRGRSRHEKMSLSRSRSHSPISKKSREYNIRNSRQFKKTQDVKASHNSDIDSFNKKKEEMKSEEIFRRDEDSHSGAVERQRNPVERPNRTSYGLLSSGARPITTLDGLGPDKRLLRKKQQEKDAAKNRYKHQHKSVMSKEDKAEKLRSMASDGNARSSYIACTDRYSNKQLLNDEIQRRKERRMDGFE